MTLPMFGVQPPQMGTDIILYHSTVNPDFLQPDVIEHASIFNDTVNYIPLGNYAAFDILVYLGKYPSPANTYSLIAQYEHQTISKFYLHYDADPFKTRSGSTLVDCPFYVELVEPAYLEDTYYYDICRIKLKSTKYIYFTNTSGGYGTDYGQDYGDGF